MLKGKVAIVTGGTRGIGYEIVRKYLQNGAKVVLWGSRQETVDKALSQLKKENPAWEVEGMCPTLTDAAAVEAAVNAVKEKFGRVDILVNNAGISQSTPLYQYKTEDFDKIIDLNVKAIFYAILPAAKIMKEQGGGCIINTSSMVSISGQPAGCGYPTSKFAVNGLTISLARELAKDGIRVNAVAPGFIDTDMTAVLPEAVRTGMTQGIPAGRAGQPEDVAQAVAFFAAEQSSYLTGQVLCADGGMAM